MTKYEEHIDGVYEEILLYYYTNSTYKQLVINKGGGMICGVCPPTDSEWFWMASYAGLLRKSTKNLHVSEEENGDIYEFLWKFNANQLPSAFGNDEGSWITFIWK